MEITEDGVCTFRRVHLCSCVEKIILSLCFLHVVFRDIKKILKVPYFDIQNGTHSVFDTSRKDVKNPQYKTKIWAQNSCLVGDKCHSATRDSRLTSCWGFVIKWVWKESSELVCFYQYSHTTEREEIWKILQYLLRSGSEPMSKMNTFIIYF